MHHSKITAKKHWLKTPAKVIDQKLYLKVLVTDVCQEHWPRAPPKSTGQAHQTRVTGKRHQLRTPVKDIIGQRQRLRKLAKNTGQGH